MASAGKQSSWPEQLLQRRLLDQLQSLPEVADLQPEALLEEFRALQLMAMYNGPPREPTGGDDPATGGDDQATVAAADGSLESGGGGGAAGGVDVRAELSDGLRASGQKGKKGIDADMEEFLLQQVRGPQTQTSNHIGKQCYLQPVCFTQESWAAR